MFLDCSRNCLYKYIAEMILSIYFIHQTVLEELDLAWAASDSQARGFLIGANR